MADGMDYISGLLRQADGFRNREQWGQAGELYERVCKAEPGNVEGWIGLGRAHVMFGRLGDGAGCFEKAERLSPGNVWALHGLGLCYMQGNQPAKAVGYLERAWKAGPEVLYVGHHLAMVLTQLRRRDEAAAVLREVVERHPGDARSWANLGTALRNVGALEESLQANLKAVELGPGIGHCWCGLAISWMDRHDAVKAEEAITKALALAPQEPLVRLTWSSFLLIVGRWKEGWEAYEARLMAHRNISDYGLKGTEWDGKELGGRRILLHAEQGLGDAIMFARWVPAVVRMGGRVVLGCDPICEPVFKGLAGVEEFCFSPAKVPEYDVRCSLLSLPMKLGVTLEKMEKQERYLEVGQEYVRKAGARLGEKKEGELRVGLVWRGNPQQGNDRNRSCPGRYLDGLAGVEGVKFYSLQKEEDGKLGEGVAMVPGEFLERPKKLQMEDLAGEMKDLGDTAGFLMNLDLVITVDTATAHLAGALGRRVWVIQAFTYEWRWLIGREDSPWYATARLFKQKRPGDWGEVIERVRGELERLKDEMKG